MKPPPARPVPYLNRELNRLAYLRRILAEAREVSNPPLERLRFLSFAASNLDEFFMIRMGELRNLVDRRQHEISPDGLLPREQIDAIRVAAVSLYTLMGETMATLLPELQARGVVIESFRTLPPQDQEAMRSFFETRIAPVLTPLAIDPSHPFPYLASSTLTIVTRAESDSGSHIILTKLPEMLPRFIPLPGESRFLPVGSLVMANLSRIIPLLRIQTSALFRVIRNADVSLREDEVSDLRESLESELKSRERKQVVAIEIDQRADEGIVNVLTKGAGVDPADIYTVEGFLKASDLLEIYDRVQDAPLRNLPFNPRLPKELASSDDIFSILRKRDLLLHRPYESFTTVLELMHAASNDADVVAIKQTLYQIDEASPILEYLAGAARRGKQVTAVIEVQARLQERKNLAWAKRLEEAGVQVVYGLVGIATHAKLCMIVRREAGELRRYLHLSTGNYSLETADQYTDLDLLTSRPELGEDAALLFNVLTGFSQASMKEIFEAESRPRWKHFVVGPFDYRPWLLERIAAETMATRNGRMGRIVAKLNNVADPAIIAALYEASRAGVSIDLIVRGICCLMPGVPGVSETIRVFSIVDRFLEHSRLFYFHNEGDAKIYAASGDWMPRNFTRRIELAFPIDDPQLRLRAMEILEASLRDSKKSWRMSAEGTYAPVQDAAAFRMQEHFIERTRSEAIRIGTFDETVTAPASFRKKARTRRKPSAPAGR